MRDWYDADAVLVRRSEAGRAALQRADMLLWEHDDEADGRRWVLRSLAELPGCTVAATRHAGGRWLVAAGRDSIHIGRPLWMTLSGDVDREIAAAAVRTLCSLLVARTALR
ncbi:hypothetical protein [Actinokineospora inagensis]|uniref:hypothetical protein n=1 Tax=Actinokineospora inagensis TaxID=103730 RepID=UPI000407328C|nr:hypothetical protein [Actinokineospora inagensis]